MSDERLYAVYGSDDDTLIAVGTARECAEVLGIKRGTLYAKIWDQRKRPDVPRMYRIYEIEEDE